MSTDLRPELETLRNLYDVARGLLGARGSEAAAAQLVYAAMGTLGARSGCVLLASAPARAGAAGRWRCVFASGISGVQGDSLKVGDAARAWLGAQGVTTLAGAAAARGLGETRDALVERFDAAVIAPIVQGDTVGGALVLGAHLFGDAAPAPQALATLEAIAALGGLAFAAPASAGEGAPGTVRTSPGGERSLVRLRREHPPLRALVGESPALLEACEDLVAVAPTRFPVLLMGESGVGKELAAHAVHELSDRAAGPFEVLDCSSIPRELIESELFGHVRGAFTGAHRDRRGAFEIAHRGTLFLDEIGEMPLQLQTRLLRVLQEGRFRRVGDEQPLETDVRIVAATNRDLRRQVEARRFREDLFYRLNVFAVRLPALRERAGDLGALVAHFLGRHGRERDWTIEPEALAALEAHRWPGNIREVGNFCAALAVRAARPGRATLADVAAVWRRQYPDQPPPWQGGAPDAARGRLGDWVLSEARAARFNLIEAARQLVRRKRAGQRVPLTERSALSYYVTGEILRALSENRGDADAATRAIAASEDLVARVAPRVARVLEALRASRGDPDRARRKFGKLPAGYEDALERAVARSAG